MSFREKIAWISALSMAGVYGVYFWWVIRTGHPAGAVAFGPLLLTVIALVVVHVVLITVVALASPRDAQAPRDERDRMIDLRATRMAYSGLVTAVVMACVFGAMTPPIIFNANSLLFILVTVEVLRCACQIVQYRRGA